MIKYGDQECTNIFQLRIVRQTATGYESWVFRMGTSMGNPVWEFQSCKFGDDLEIQPFSTSATQSHRNALGLPGFIVLVT